MAITNSTDGIYNTADGLRWKYGRAQTVKGVAGEFNMPSSTHVSEIELDYATVNLGTDDTNVYVLDFDSVLPNGAVVEKIEVKVGTAWDSAGNGAKLNIGTVKKDSAGIFNTIDDADGLINSLAETEFDTAGAIHVIYQEDEATGAGAQLGVALTYDVVLCAYQETEAWTAGTGVLRVFWRTAA